MYAVEECESPVRRSRSSTDYRLHKDDRASTHISTYRSDKKQVESVTKHIEYGIPERL